MKAKVFIIMLLAITWFDSNASNGDVTLEQSGANNRACTIRNDLVSIYINTSGEIASFVLYKNGDGDFNNSVQFMDQDNKSEDCKGYFSLANSSGAVGLSISSFYVKLNNTDVCEVQYVANKNNLEWVIGYIVRRGISGVYQYVMVNSKAANTSFSEARYGFRGDPDIFNYAYISDDVQESLPTPAEIANATKVTDATFKLSNGSIYTKYNYAAFQKDDAVHGMMGDNVGIWSISPTEEWLNGGPMRQDLTVHATCVCKKENSWYT